MKIGTVSSQIESGLRKLKADEYYASLEKEKIACPLTGSRTWEHVLTGDRYGMGIQTMICPESGFIATNPRPTEAALNKFYRHHYRDYYFSYSDPRSDDYLNSLNYKIVRRRAEWLLDFCEEAMPCSNPAVIDIGCADGHFLELFKVRFPKASLTGIDPDERYGGEARRRTGAEILIGDFNEIVSGIHELTGRHDLLVLSHVLEHLAEPGRKLDEMAKLLKPGGRILVEVPNILSFAWRGLGMFHIGHINHFYPETLVLLLENAGFQLEEIFHGNHPADPWAMTALGIKVQEPRSSRFRLVTKSDQISGLKNFIEDRAQPRCRQPSFIEHVWKRVNSRFGRLSVC